MQVVTQLLVRNYNSLQVGFVCSWCEPHNCKGREGTILSQPDSIFQDTYLTLSELSLNRHIYLWADQSLVAGCLWNKSSQGHRLPVTRARAFHFT